MEVNARGIQRPAIIERECPKCGHLIWALWERQADSLLESHMQKHREKKKS